MNSYFRNICSFFFSLKKKTYHFSTLDSVHTRCISCIYIITGTSSLFQIYSSGELHHFIDGFNEDKSNWMRYVNPGYSVQEQNLAACQNGMNIYFYTIKPIPANQELLVWYCRDFAERLHYPSSRELTMMNLSKWITV